MCAVVCRACVSFLQAAGHVTVCYVERERERRRRKKKNKQTNSQTNKLTNKQNKKQQL